jgi:hypothetical protein
VKRIKYTRHARNRMRRHRISEIEVESAMRSPEHLTSSIEGRMNAWVKLPDRFLRVTYKEENGELAVITAVKKKKGWG